MSRSRDPDLFPRWVVGQRRPAQVPVLMGVGEAQGEDDEGPSASIRFCPLCNLCVLLQKSHRAKDSIFSSSLLLGFHPTGAP